MKEAADLVEEWLLILKNIQQQLLWNLFDFACTKLFLVDTIWAFRSITEKGNIAPVNSDPVWWTPF